MAIDMSEVKAVTGQKGYATLHGLAVKDASTKKIYFYVDSNSVSNDIGIARTGVLFYKLSDTKQASDMNTENMIVENKETLGIIDGGKNNENRYSPSVSNVVSGVEYGIVVRPYVKFSDDSYVYGDIIETSYTEVATKYPDYLIPSLPVQAATGILLSYTWDIDDADTITSMGIVYTNDKRDDIDINTEGATIVPVPALCNHGTCTNILPDTGDGISMMGYCEINGQYYYTRAVHVTYDDVALDRGRNVRILQSMIWATPYTDPPLSPIEELLLELKDVIENL